MQELIENFSKQLKEALSIGENAKLTDNKKPILNVVISGMGGSGIGGTIVSELVSQKSKIPISVSKSYFLPEYVNENTLVIISSYSGNTEETIQSLEIALDKKAKVVCITSGGKILKIAQTERIDHIIIPAGMPPRAAVGYSMVQTFFILNYFNIINNDFRNDFENAINLLVTEKENIKTEARRIAQILVGKLVVIYTPARSEGVAVRLQQNLNENSKILAWHNAIPEMNHNEILGWTEKKDDLAVIFLRNQTDYSRVSKRIDLTKEHVLKYAGNVIEIYAKGGSPIERALYHIHIGDWISILLAEIKNIDPKEIKIVDNFKSALAEI